MSYIEYELLPEYTEKSQLTDLFTEHEFLGWLGLFTIFILLCTVLYFQLKIWDSEDKSEENSRKNLKKKQFRSKK